MPLEDRYCMKHTLPTKLDEQGGCWRCYGTEKLIKLGVYPKPKCGRCDRLLVDCWCPDDG